MATDPKRTLNVIVATDGKSWNAQGVEIDYAACGQTPDDAIQRFETGLTRTRALENRTPGAVRATARPAETEAWAQLLATTEGRTVRVVRRKSAGAAECSFGQSAYVVLDPPQRPAGGYVM